MELDNWTYYIKKNFNSFKNDVIEDMIKFYGKKYKDIIIKRLDEINFIFYGNIKNGIPSKKQSYSGKKDIIYQTKEIDYSEYTKSCIQSDITAKIVSFNCYYDFDKNNVNKYILMPLFATDEDIIHEMIHAITYEPLYVNIENQSYRGKSGFISSDDNGEILLEEAITELEAKLIYRSLIKNRNKIFINEYKDETSNCYYNNFIPLITKFHRAFFRDITYSRISLNKRFLIEHIGKDLYLDFINYISCYAEDLYSESKDRYIPLINISIDDMKNNYKVKKLI